MGHGSGIEISVHRLGKGDAAGESAGSDQKGEQSIGIHVMKASACKKHIALQFEVAGMGVLLHVQLDELQILHRSPVFAQKGNHARVAV